MGDCKVHTGIPSNSLRCTFSPSVVNHGGLSLASSGAAKLRALRAPKSFPTAPMTRNGQQRIPGQERWFTLHRSSARAGGGLRVGSQARQARGWCTDVAGGHRVDRLAVECQGFGDQPVFDVTGQRVGRRRVDGPLEFAAREGQQRPHGRRLHRRCRRVFGERGQDRTQQGRGRARYDTGRGRGGARGHRWVLRRRHSGGGHGRRRRRATDGRGHHRGRRGNGGSRQHRRGW